MSMKPLSRRQMAWRAAQDLEDGACVNLGIGLPTLCSDFIPAGREIVFHSENGILGMGPAPKPGEEDQDLINAGKQLVTLLPGGVYFHHNDAFLMIRGGHLDIALLGAFEVSEAGDLANWTTEDPDFPPGVGGAMDLAVGAREVRVLVEHTTKDGRPRIRKRCQYPLTAQRCVKRVYTNLAVLDVTRDGIVVREMVEGLDIEGLQERTEAKLILANDWKRLTVPAV
ncbi:MAG TPA: 3-oxoacid CoA-transferase subunit B [Stellaceae bacterium]|nr:3-oxoacid CoA-transferase subunit B [Stellaceae bacterium]